MVLDVGRFITDIAKISGLLPLRQYFIEFMAAQGLPFVYYILRINRFRVVKWSEAVRAEALPLPTVYFMAQRLRDANQPGSVHPLAAHAFNCGRPFIFSREPSFSALSGDDADAVNLFQNAGIHDAAVTVIRYGAQVAFFFLGSRSILRDMSCNDLLLFDAICERMHKRYEQIRLQTSPRTALTARERDVLALIANGKSNWAMARILGLSVHSIDSYVRRCFQKLGANSRIDAVIAAMEQGVPIIMSASQDLGRNENSPEYAQSIIDGEDETLNFPKLND